MKINIKPRSGILIGLFILLTSYSLFEARALIIGPQIWITSPKNGGTFENSLVTMEGQSRNIAWISLNGRQIFTDESGAWNEKVIVSPGLSIMTVSARDRFGRETHKSVQVVLK
jgi:hypothetical protein